MLLFGSCGFIGSHVRRVAGESGFDVIGTSRRAGAADLVCDLLDPDSITEAIRQARPDSIVNLAGSSSVAASWKVPEAAFAGNATAVLNLLDAMVRDAPGAHLLCVSSAEVYGESAPDGPPLTEDLPLAPLSPYGASKVAMEVLCGTYERSHDLRIAVIRAFNQIGTGQSAAFVASGFARQIAEAEAEGREKLDLRVGNLSAERDFTDVRDAARAYCEIAARSVSGTFNVCSGSAVSIEDLVDAMRAASRIPVEIAPAPELARPRDPRRVTGSPDRLNREIGWVPEIPLETTVGDLLDWWRAEVGAPASG